MREVVRSTDVVFLSWLTALLRDAGIEAVVLDAFTSVMEGSINAIPRRLMVADEDFENARRLAVEAEREVAEGAFAEPDPADPHA
jgi:hypothetical protein